uniref:Uncharacterized protein n=1 Tax=Lactuca sativa TaxID=4236 RepID=A0A9R1XSH2_LACSA|nr:hypothetical protein LSAT_V11C200076940 [Lactuca sativa]
MLQFFLPNLISQINTHKSHIMVIGVNQSVSCLLIWVFQWENMSLVEGWSDAICKVTCKLSNCKVKSLSVGGRLTLLKSVLGALPTYFISLLRIRKVFLKTWNL